MITLKNISKVYGTKDTKTVGLDNINISIEKGEFVSVMGTSGSGKTTLLNVIGAMDSITSGEYIFEDIHVEKLSKSQLTAFRKENIGFVFQHFALMNHYTVFE
ncbi:MAG: ATP-binding cassette domain-containing protein, partial [Lachnospiraceae bacterium]|nr:ATP-binding cassette domain-containing protein [Lachnospiraceae bacterium]